MAFFIAIMLFAAPVSANIWGFLFKPHYTYYPADINGQDLNIGHLIARDANFDVLQADTIFSRKQVNEIEIDLNVVNDGNFQGNVGITGDTFVGDIYGEGDINFRLDYFGDKHQLVWPAYRPSRQRSRRLVDSSSPPSSQAA